MIVLFLNIAALRSKRTTESSFMLQKTFFPLYFFSKMRQIKTAYVADAALQNT